MSLINFTYNIFCFFRLQNNFECRTLTGLWLNCDFAVHECHDALTNTQCKTVTVRIFVKDSGIRGFEKRAKNIGQIFLRYADSFVNYFDLKFNIVSWLVNLNQLYSYNNIAVSFWEFKSVLYQVYEHLLYSEKVKLQIDILGKF